MPIYEYACDDCQKNFEVFLSVRDKAVQECALCGGKNIRKLISNCSFQLKGTGWYKTDYAAKDSPAPSDGTKATAGGKPASADGASPAGESKTTSSSSATDSKPASSEKAA